MAKKQEEKYIVFVIAGGHGKVIMATAVIEAMKKEHPDRKIVVVAAWDGPFFGNPHVWRFYTFEQMNNYFYDDYINNKDVLIFQHDPYHEQSYLLREKHLNETWAEMYGIPFNNEQPKLHLNPREIEIAKDKIKPEQGKPIMILQTHGGLPNSQYSKKSWARDMPMEVAQKLVNYYSKSYRILHIRLPEQPALKNVEAVTLPHRELYAVMSFSKKRLLIDSFLQHVAASLDLPSTVCWISNDPKVFGYEMHDNIRPSADKIYEMNKFSFLEQYDITGQIQQFPYDNVNLFDINQIMESLKKQ